MSPVNYRIEDIREEKGRKEIQVVHVEKLKKYYLRDDEKIKPVEIVDYIEPETRILDDEINSNNFSEYMNKNFKDIQQQVQTLGLLENKENTETPNKNMKLGSQIEVRVLRSVPSPEIPGPSSSDGTTPSETSQSELRELANEEFSNECDSISLEEDPFPTGNISPGVPLSLVGDGLEAGEISKDTENRPTSGVSCPKRTELETHEATVDRDVNASRSSVAGNDAISEPIETSVERETDNSISNFPVENTGSLQASGRDLLPVQPVEISSEKQSENAEGKDANPPPTTLSKLIKPASHSVVQNPGPSSSAILSPRERELLLKRHLRQNYRSSSVSSINTDTSTRSGRVSKPPTRLEPSFTRYGTKKK